MKPTKVDVLLVMQDCVTVARVHIDKHLRHADEVEAARDAVAELIAADKAYDHANANRIEADNRITSGDRSDDAFRRQASAHHAYDRAVDRRRIAIANMGAA